MIDDQFLDTQVQEDSRPSIMAFPVKAFQLYQILDDILVKIYLPCSQKRGIKDMFDIVSEIDQQIHAWTTSLPAHLCYQHGTKQDDPIIDRQCTILNIRSVFPPDALFLCFQAMLTSVVPIVPSILECYYSGRFWLSSSSRVVVLVAQQTRYLV
jgi:hypothetical protein